VTGQGTRDNGTSELRASSFKEEWGYLRNTPQNTMATFLFFKLVGFVCRVVAVSSSPSQCRHRCRSVVVAVVVIVVVIVAIVVLSSSIGAHGGAGPRASAGSSSSFSPVVLVVIVAVVVVESTDGRTSQDMESIRVSEGQDGEVRARKGCE
jgi:hypothetical protein